MKQRLRGAIVFSFLSGLIAAVFRWAVNPWFMDQPTTYAIFTLVPLLPLGWWVGPHLPQRFPIWQLALGSMGLFGMALIPPITDALAPKLVLVGVDGATWTVADKVDLPNLEAVAKEGARGTLMATEPLLSSVLWTTIATGRRPQVHGIQGPIGRSDRVRSARFWDIARDSGLSIGLYKWLVTWPLPSADMTGFVVPAWLAAEHQTHPEDLLSIQQLQSHIRGREAGAPPPILVMRSIPKGLRWSTIWAGIRFYAMEGIAPLPDRKKHAFVRRLIARMDRDVFIASLHRYRPDVATFTIYVTEALSRSHWSRDGGQYVESAYRFADQIIGEIRAELQPDTPFMVLSEHGFRNSGEKAGEHAAFPKSEPLKEWMKISIGDLDIVRVGRNLVVTPDVPIDDALFRETLSQLRVGEGDPLYDVEVFPNQSGWRLSLLNVPPEKEWPDHRVGSRPLSDWVQPGRSEAGEHDESGMVVLSGADLDTRDLGAVSQLDVMPTMMAILGLPVADDFPGQSWVPEKTPRVSSYKHLVPSLDPESSGQGTGDIRDLGYLD